MQLSFLEIIERERGWGPRSDGYLAFISDKDAIAFIQRQYADRSGPAPDYYVSYEHVGWHPVSDSVADKLQAASNTELKHMYFDNIKDALNDV